MTFKVWIFNRHKMSKFGQQVPCKKKQQLYSLFSVLNKTKKKKSRLFFCYLYPIPSRRNRNLVKRSRKSQTRIWTEQIRERPNHKMIPKAPTFESKFDAFSRERERERFANKPERSRREEEVKKPWRRKRKMTRLTRERAIVAFLKDNLKRHWWWLWWSISLSIIVKLPTLWKKERLINLLLLQTL